MWCIDGTFKISPKNFYQVIIITCRIYNRYFPVTYIMLPNKLEETYVYAFQVLLDHLVEVKIKFIITDFEIGLSNACKKVFKEAKIRLCLFHLSQSIWRKVQKFGLVTEYKEDPHLRNCIKMLLCLCFVEQTQIKKHFQYLIDYTKVYCREKIYNILEYFKSCYIGEKSKYKYEEWSCYERLYNQIPLTTNINESFNNVCSKFIGCSHPSIANLITELRLKDYEINKKITESMVVYDKNDLQKIYYSTKYNSLKRVMDNENSYFGCDFLIALCAVYQFGLN